MYSPTLDEFLKLATQGNLIPVTRRLLADIETPLSAYRKIRGPGRVVPVRIGRGRRTLGRYSFVGCNPRAVIRQVGQPRRGDRERQGRRDVRRSKRSRRRPPRRPSVRDGLEVVERVMKQVSRRCPVPGLPRFTGGAVGFIGYEFIHDVEPVVPRPPHDDLQTPVMYFLIADQLLIFDRVAQTITVLVNAVLDEAASPAEAYEDAVGEIERLVSLLEQPSEHRPVTRARRSAAAALRVEHAAGEVPRQRAQGQGIHHRRATSSRWSARSASPRRSRPRRWTSTAPPARSIRRPTCSCSNWTASRSSALRRKSTSAARTARWRSAPSPARAAAAQTPEEDLALEKELLADPKERAEHVMLVDLARNDLGRVCDFGTVQVKDLMIIERYSHVMHIVSQVEGRLSADKTPYDLMRATFPAGTLSGAPKIRAMQIISELEQTARGPYGGCVGYFSFNGNLDCCITIRTALLKDGRAYVQAGGGWVNDSTPEGEYQETVNKSKAMLKAVAMAESFRELASGLG